MTTEISRRKLLKCSSAVAVTALSGCAGAKSRPALKSSMPSKSTGSPEYALWDAVETADRIASGEISALEAVEAAIRRAEVANPLINAIVTDTFESARETASSVTGPFAGVPTFIKDMEYTQGVPTQFGSRAFKGFIPPHSGEFVKSAEAAGLISLGKSTTPEFGATATTETLAQGPTRNPWNYNHSAGGSSGGASALVAAGVVPVAIASDGGGSTRMPASCCGLVGLKPSRNFYKYYSDGAQTPPIDMPVPGIVSRSVRDTAKLSALMQQDSSASAIPSLGEVNRKTSRPLRIGMFTQGFTHTATPDVAASIEKTALICEELGHKVKFVSNPWRSQQLADDLMLYWASLNASAVGFVEQNILGRPATSDDIEPWTIGLVEHYKSNTGEIENTIERLKLAGRAYGSHFDEVDLYLTPVLSAAPPEIGYLSPELPFETHKERLSNYSNYTAISNLSGAPAISLPIGFSANGLPIGSHFMARFGDERTLIELAYELEEASPWNNNRAPGFVYG